MNTNKTKVPTTKPAAFRLDATTERFLDSTAKSFATSKSNVIRACIRSVRSSSNADAMIERFL